MDTLVTKVEALQAGIAQLKAIIEAPVVFPGPTGMDFDEDGAMIIDDTEDQKRKNRDA